MSTTVKKEVISWVKTILLAAVLAGLVNSFLIVNAEVPTGSMENTIMAGDRILALRTSYWFDEPEAISGCPEFPEKSRIISPSI